MITFPPYEFDESLRDVPSDPVVWDDFIKELKLKRDQEKDLTERQNLEATLGVAYRMTGQLDLAEVVLLRALGSTHLSVPRLIQNQIRLAHVYQWRREFTKAQVLFDQARHLLNQNPELGTLQAAFHQHHGKYYFDQGDFGNALCEFELALKIRKRIQSPADQLDSSRRAIAEAKKRLRCLPDSEFTIRVAEIRDAEGIHDAHMKSINEICSKDHSPEEIRVWGGRAFNPDFRIPAIQSQYYLVVEKDEGIEGFCQLRLGWNDGQKTAYLFGLYVTPVLLKKNVGGAFMNLVLAFCRGENVQKIDLVSTITSLGFYKRFGFKPTGEMSGVVMQGVKVRGYPMQLVK